MANNFCGHNKNTNLDHQTLFFEIFFSCPLLTKRYVKCVWRHKTQRIRYLSLGTTTQLRCFVKYKKLKHFKDDSTRRAIAQTTYIQAHTKNLFSSSHSSNSIHTSEHKTRKNNNTCFGAYWYSTSTQHGNLHPAGWPILFCALTQEAVLATANIEKKLGRGFEKCRWMDRTARN